MLRILQEGNSLPYSWPCHNSATFSPGMLAQLTIEGNTPVATVSNGNAPIGIIDDIRTKAFTAVAWDEEVIIDAPGMSVSGGRIVSTIDVMKPLDNPNILPDSFVSNPVSLQLIPRNGIVVIPAGTELNYDKGGTGTPNAFKTHVRYTYQIPNVIGDDTTQGSNRITVWFQRGIYQTDVFDTSASFPLNANLFCNEKGMFTTKQITPNHPSIAIVTSCPTSSWPWLELMYL